MGIQGTTLQGPGEFQELCTSFNGTKARVEFPRRHTQWGPLSDKGKERLEETAFSLFLASRATSPTSSYLAI